MSTPASPPGDPDAGPANPLPPPGSLPAVDQPYGGPAPGTQPYPPAPYAAPAPPSGIPPYAAPPPGAYAGYGPGQPAPARPSDRLATIAVVLGIIGVIPGVGLLALVLGIVALVRIGQGRARGAWMAVTAIVLAVAWMGGTAAVVATGSWDRIREVAVSGRSDDGIRDTDGRITSKGVIATQRLRVGDCFLDPSLVGLDEGEATEVSSVHAVPCSEPHDLEVYAVVPVEADRFPSDENVLAQAESDCVARFEGFVGVPVDDSSLDIYYYLPTAVTWSRIDHNITCSVADSTRTTGTLRDAQR